MKNGKLRKIVRDIYHYPKERHIKNEYRNFLKNEIYHKYNYVDRTMSYLNNMKNNVESVSFSNSSHMDSIYSVTYGCLVEAMYGEISNDEKIELKNYFDTHQRKEDGLYWDRKYDVKGFFYGTDGWGARHLVPHITIALDRIDYQPKYEFTYLDKYKNPDDMIRWLDSLDYHNVWGSSNAIMNYGVAMQYARDRMNGNYSSSIAAMEEYLLKRINSYGMWYEGEISSPEDRNEMIRGAYHILPILYYDGIEVPNCENAVEEILKSQNKWGGFDTYIASSACEDIDGLDPLLRYSIMAGMTNDKRVIDAINKAENWILFNQNEDGGFVFEKDTPFSYGGQKTLSSVAGESNMFATWFRCVSLELINEFFDEKKSVFIRTPGYELPLRKGECR